MLSRVTRVPLLAAAIGAGTILAAGCAGGSSSGGHASGATPAAQVTPQQALLLAARSSQKVNSFDATMNVQATAGATGSFTLAGTIREQIHPSILAEADISKFGGAAGQVLPGGLSEIITQDAFYLKAAPLTQSLHTTKPWAEIKLSSLGSTGTTLQSLFSQVQSNSPLSQTQLLSTSKDVRKVGTSVINGVPVTEYAGTYSMSQALAALPASERATVGKYISAAGITSTQFKVWIDGQDQARKIVITEAGTVINETVTINVTSYNQPVNIQLPAPGETYVVPASALGGTTGQGTAS